MTMNFLLKKVFLNYQRLWNKIKKLKTHIIIYTKVWMIQLMKIFLKMRQGRSILCSIKLYYNTKFDDILKI